MTLRDYLDGMLRAKTVDELEAAIQVPFKHALRDRTWNRICAVREEVGRAICAAHPLGIYVPTFGPRRQLAVCGKEYRVAHGGNSTGERYLWHYAGEWAMGVLMANGFTRTAAHRLWDAGWRDYPHRCLAIVERALAGDYPDPKLNVLIRYERTDSGQPIQYTVEQNDADKRDRRASRPCACGGTLFDWGAGHSYGFDYISWHCNKCSDVFTEYLPPSDLYALRQKGSPK